MQCTPFASSLLFPSFFLSFCPLLFFFSALLSSFSPLPGNVGDKLTTCIQMRIKLEKKQCKFGGSRGENGVGELDFKDKDFLLLDKDC